MKKNSVRRRSETIILHLDFRGKAENRKRITTEKCVAVNIASYSLGFSKILSFLSSMSMQQMHYHCLCPRAKNYDVNFFSDADSLRGIENTTKFLITWFPLKGFAPVCKLFAHRQEQFIYIQLHLLARFHFCLSL